MNLYTPNLISLYSFYLIHCLYYIIRHPCRTTHSYRHPRKFLVIFYARAQLYCATNSIIQHLREFRTAWSKCKSMVEVSFGTIREFSSCNASIENPDPERCIYTLLDK